MKHPTRLRVTSVYGEPGDVWIENGKAKWDDSIAWLVEPDPDGPMGDSDPANGPAFLATVFLALKTSSTDRAKIVEGEDPGDWDDVANLSARSV